MKFPGPFGRCVATRISRLLVPRIGCCRTSFTRGLLLLILLPPLLLRADEPIQKRSPPRLLPLPATVPTPDDNPSTPAKVELGKQLFFDPRLSGNNQMSCATCHQPDKGWGDGRKVALGIGDKPLTRNTPSLLNVAFLPVLFWDGRATGLEEQALIPITAADEMNQPLDELERELAAVPGYVQQFREVFDTEVRRAGIARALAAFQRTLVTGPSPVDRYLKGEKDALSEDAVRGLELFTGEAGCIRCHHGPLLSDGKFHRIGHSMRDHGREVVTKKSDDRYRFRTPPLRNIAQTGPYMHDGGLDALYYVAVYYLRSVPVSGPDNLPLEVEARLHLSFGDIQALTAFLNALSGPAPTIKRPKLP